MTITIDPETLLKLGRRQADLDEAARAHNQALFGNGRDPYTLNNMLHKEKETGKEIKRLVNSLLGQERPDWNTVEQLGTCLIRLDNIQAEFRGTSAGDEQIDAEIKAADKSRQKLQVKRDSLVDRICSKAQAAIDQARQELEAAKADEESAHDDEIQAVGDLRDAVQRARSASEADEESARADVEQAHATARQAVDRLAAAKSDTEAARQRLNQAERAAEEAREQILAQARRAADELGRRAEPTAAV